LVTPIIAAIECNRLIAGQITIDILILSDFFSVLFTIQ